MATNTTNYNFTKPEDTDNADLKVFVGQNMDKVDTELKRVENMVVGTFGNFKIQFNSTTNTLDFVYIG